MTYDAGNGGGVQIISALTAVNREIIMNNTQPNLPDYNQRTELVQGIKLVWNYTAAGRFCRCCWSPDGLHLALPSRDGNLYVLNIENRQVRILCGHREPVISAAFAGNGPALKNDGLKSKGCSVLASGSYGDHNNIFIWERDSDEPYTLCGHAGLVCTLAFAPDGTLISGSHFDHTIKFWNLADKRLLKSIYCPGVTSLAIGPGGCLACSTLSGDVRVYENGQLYRNLSGHSGPCLQLAWANANSAEDMTLASASKDGTIRIWDVHRDESLTVLKSHDYHVLSVAYAPGLPLLYSKSRDHTERIWRIDKPMEIVRLESRGEEIGWNCSGAWHPMFPRVPLLASVSDGDKTVRLLEVDLEALLGEFD
ncbi:MAG: WD40 repeat domain-containing protein [Deltaproteobacteria bacterium]|nr:WD40 repeat domain-containing protein [Deltaproteobacteria bacterium]